MRLETAYGILRVQDGGLRKVDDTRFVMNGYEYRLKYFGGFAPIVDIQRREVGRRNFKYYGSVGVHDLWTAGQVMDRVMEQIKKKEGINV